MTSLEKLGGRAAFLAVAGVLWACDIPTDPPMLEQEWIVPIAATSIDAVEFLPEGVDLTQDESAFTVDVDPISFQETLGTLCDECAGLDGLTVPKPAFNKEFADSVALPEKVESVDVQAGRLRVVAQNLFGFDPLRPKGGDTGSFTLALHNGSADGPVLDETVVDGDDTSFAPGTTLTRDLEYSGPITSSLWITVSVNSPAGGEEPGNWVPISLDDEIRVTVTPEVLEVESAGINVAGEVFDLPVTDLNVDAVDGTLVDHVTEGSFQMEIVNPWSVGAILTFIVDGPTMDAPVILIASVPATPTSTVQVEFTQAELRSFLGEPDVVLTGQGTVNQEAGTVTLAPDQTMTIDARLDLVIVVG